MSLPLVGRRALITGGTQGIGYEVALALAGAGADVVLVGRRRTSVDAAVDTIVRRHPHARASGEILDLARLDTVRALADRLRADGRPIDLLVNNAAIMAP